ncbi:hypothetical protein HYH03_003074 [Edaphochlamys debaryana]|uniref:Uncharacterized protein n=1 Tax=Edaphochlamys debaryana TaxID=47281 RepID=A0A836C4L7_9CHLO|nr:hypothetical protein HYH03_003074 [Edaphochlamys debaryana]|eukprot:KAG2498882.1 hypothetical protein HYH03_003074 [Edaphochlamys debaryana]
MNPDVGAKVKDALGDAGLRFTLAVAGVVAAGAAVVVPTGKQVEKAALDLYGRPPSQLLGNERRCAEFSAGYRRWNSFVENSVYSWTRKLPGHDNPIVNPYKGPRRLTRPQQKVEEEVEAASKE